MAKAEGGHECHEKLAAGARQPGISGKRSVPRFVGQDAAAHVGEGENQQGRDAERPVGLLQQQPKGRPINGKGENHISQMLPAGGPEHPHPERDAGLGRATGRFRSQAQPLPARLPRGISGVVEGIQIFSTSLRTGDNKAVIVPNSTITSGTITNYSAKDTRRVDLVFGIGYSDDIGSAKNILQKLVDEDDRILKDPAPVIAVSELADNSVNIIVRPWTSTADYSNVYLDLTEKVKLTFDKEGISIPFPQRDVHLHQDA